MPADLIKSLHFALRFIAVVALFAFVTSCDEDDEPSNTVVNEGNRHVNDWISENMDFWYLWSNELPASPNKDLSPGCFLSIIAQR